MKYYLQTFGLIILLFNLSILVNGQGAVDYFNELKLPTGVPNSPEVMGIEKFGNFPVNYSTGVPDISIPVWNIKCGSLNWPVSLSYHAGGIKVDEIASMAGLGWSLTGQSAISRTVVGKPDEYATEPDYNTVSAANYEYLYLVKNGGADSEFDVFNFNFNGRSGKFIVKQDGNIMQIPTSDLKVTYTSGFGSFTITDENGIKYLFNNQELTTSSTSPSQSDLYPSSWYITRVELPDKKNVIEFSYDFGGALGQNYYTFTHALGEKYGPGPTGPNLPGATLTSLNQAATSFNNVLIQSLRLKSISFPNGSLVLNYDNLNRKDLGAAIYTKLSSISVNKVVNGVATPIKKFNLQQSYFYYNPKGASSEWPELYRLRLDGLEEVGMPGETSPKQYTFEYNTTPIVPRGNYGQDIWGFNNDKWLNTTLLQQQRVTFQSGSTLIDLNIGGADRSVNADKMKACILSSITYPTGGKTVFDFEPHTYKTGMTNTTSGTAAANASGLDPQSQTAVTTFTLPANVVEYSTRLQINMTKYNFPGVTQRSVVSLKNTTTGTTIYLTSQPYPDQSYVEDRPISLQAGNTYELKAQVFSGSANSGLLAGIGIKWETSTSQPVIGIGGGLRIKEIKNYLNKNDNIASSKDTYVYEDAITLTPYKLISQQLRDVYYRYGSSGGSGLTCTYFYSPLCKVYYSNSVYKTSNSMGSPMLYPKVQKISVDPVTNVSNGKSEYIYDIIQDEPTPIGAGNTVYPIAVNDWQNGFLQSETHFKTQGGGYIPVKSISNGYILFNTTYSNYLIVKANRIHEGCSQYNQATVGNDITYYPFPVKTGSKRLRMQEIKEINANEEIATTTYHSYNSSLYSFPTETVIIDSRNNQNSTLFKRAPDFMASGNVYEKMNQQNMLAPIIEKKNYNGTTHLGTLKTDYYDFYNDGKVIAPEAIRTFFWNNSIENRIFFNKYDLYGNTLEQQKADDVKQSYIWDYSNTHPIAEVLNSPVSDIAHTSFEADGKGNWTFSGAPSADATAPTGKKAYTLGSSIIKSGLSTATTYIVSYWKKSGSVSVNGTSSTTGNTINGWTYHEHKVVNPAGGLITVSGTSGVIDELRLYPAGAQMTTYTYNPLIGMTSQCDVNNRIIYYEYDDFGRLMLIRDQDRNILKKYCYNYQGQTESCEYYGNQAISQTRRRNNCTGCQMGSLVTYSVPANTYYATTQPAANTLAQDDITANAQNYANANGTCTASVMASLLSSNLITNKSFTVVFHNNCTSANYTYTLNANTSNVTLSPQIPTGNYNVTFTPVGGGTTNYGFWVNGFYEYGASGNILGVDILPGSNDVRVYP